MLVRERLGRECVLVEIDGDAANVVYGADEVLDAVAGCGEEPLELVHVGLGDELGLKTNQKGDLVNVFGLEPVRHHTSWWRPSWESSSSYCMRRLPSTIDSSVERVPCCFSTFVYAAYSAADFERGSLDNANCVVD